MSAFEDLRTKRRASYLWAGVVLSGTIIAAQAQEPTKGSLGSSSATPAPSLDPTAEKAPKSPPEMEADTLGPPVKTKTFRIGRDGKPK